LGIVALDISMGKKNTNIFSLDFHFCSDEHRGEP